MKMISATIKHFKLDEVRRSLSEAGIQGMTITDVKGFGRQKGHVEVYRGTSYEVNFIPKVKIEIAVPDKMADAIINVIINSARTGEVGDGKIFVYSIDDVIRIRTGEKGEDAL